VVAEALESLSEPGFLDLRTTDYWRFPYAAAHTACSRATVQSFLRCNEMGESGKLLDQLHSRDDVQIRRKEAAFSVREKSTTAAQSNVPSYYFSPPASRIGCIHCLVDMHSATDSHAQEGTGHQSTRSQPRSQPSCYLPISS
jgi:hypothetical protein